MLIRDIIKLDINTTTLKFNNVELGKSNYKEYNKIVDSYINLNNNIHIDLECNTSPYNNVKSRNILYLNKMSTKVLETGEKPKNLKDIYLIQININSSIYDNKFGYEINGLFGKKTCNKLSDFEHILIYNIEYYRNLFYNEGVNLNKHEMWLVVLSSKNFKELFTTLNYVVDEKTKNKLIKDVIDMFSDGFRLDDWKKEHVEALNEIVRISVYNDGIEQGIERGIEQNTVNTIKSMLKKNYPIEEVSDITGMSLNEFKNIKNSMF